MIGSSILNFDIVENPLFVGGLVFEKDVPYRSILAWRGALTQSNICSLYRCAISQPGPNIIRYIIRYIILENDDTYAVNYYSYTNQKFALLQPPIPRLYIPVVIRLQHLRFNEPSSSAAVTV